MPEQFNPERDINISFAQNKEVDLDAIDKFKMDSVPAFPNCIIIKHTNRFLSVWNFLFVLSCCCSSYFYAYLAAFKHPGVNLKQLYTELTFEGIFLVTLLVNFITDYMEDGNPTPVRDLNKICQRYLKGQFIFDFIPLIPLPHLTLWHGQEKYFYLIKVVRLVIGI